LNRTRLLRGTALACAVLVLVVTLASAFVRLSNAGLGCEPWPQCYGEHLRALQASGQPPAGESPAVLFARKAHRTAASTALLLVVALLVISLGPRPYLRREAKHALALFGLVVFLAVLGRWTAGARVPAVAMGNLLGGFLMLAICWRLSQPPPPPLTPRLGRLARVGTLVLLVQVALGALVSASWAGLSCPGLLDCSPLGDAGGSMLSGLNPWREPVIAADAPLNPAGALAQLLHRLGAIAVLAVAAPLAVGLLRVGRPWAGGALLALLVAQLALGLLQVAMSLPLAVVLAHNLVAALLLATLLGLLPAAAHGLDEGGARTGRA
jgi:heme a synthase